MKYKNPLTKSMRLHNFKNMSDAKFMSKLYNKPTQNMNQEETEAYSSGQNKGIIAGISMFPIGRGISAFGGILSKAPALAKAIRAFTNAPKQYLTLATKGINTGDKVKKASVAKDLAQQTPRTKAGGGPHPIISGGRDMTKFNSGNWTGF